MDKHRKLGFYLKKDINKPITCKDLTLKQQLECLREILLLNIREKEWDKEEFNLFQLNLEKEVNSILSEIKLDDVNNTLSHEFECILLKFENKNWSLEEYKNFMIQLLKIDVVTFSKVYPLIINFIGLPKEELKEKIEYYNSKLNLHLFDSKSRIDGIKINKTINDQNKLVSTIEYVHAEHVFEPKDLLLFINALLSKVRSFNQILFNKYQSKIESHSLKKDMQLEIEMLLEQFQTENSEMVKIISDSYYEWIKELSKDDIVYIYLCNELPEIITRNRLRLEKKRLDCVMKGEKEHNIYLAERVKYFAKDKAKKNSQPVKGKFI